MHTGKLLFFSGATYRFDFQQFFNHISIGGKDESMSPDWDLNPLLQSLNLE